jgi:hypothetical protein
VSLDGISGLLGQPTICGLPAIIKILDLVQGYFANQNQLFGLQKNCQECLLMLQNPFAKTIQAFSRESQHAGIGAMVAAFGPWFCSPGMGLGT